MGQLNNFWRKYCLVVLKYTTREQINNIFPKSHFSSIYITTVLGKPLIIKANEKKQRFFVISTTSSDKLPKKCKSN